MKKITTILSAMLFAGILSAQITVTDANIGNVGQTIITAYDSTYVDLSGTSGASQTWDLTGLTAADKDTIVFQDPTGWPGINAFPGANLGVQDDSSYTYIISNSSEFTFLGTYDVSGGIADTFIFNWKWLTFPSNDGTDFTGTLSEETQSYDLSTFGIGVDSVVLTFGASYTSLIDGWGIVETPTGKWDALRQKMDFNQYLRGMQYTGGVGTPLSAAVQTLFQLDTGIVSTSSMYRWWGNDVNAAFFIAGVDTGDVFAGNQYLDVAPAGPPIGIYMTDEVPAEVSVYPNPVVRNFNIDLKTEQGRAVLRNIVGQKMAEKIIFRGNNIVDVNNLPQGIYLLDIQNQKGETIQTEKLEVVK